MVLSSLLLSLGAILPLAYSFSPEYLPHPPIPHSNEHPLNAIRNPDDTPTNNPTNQPTTIHIDRHTFLSRLATITLTTTAATTTTTPRITHATTPNPGQLSDHPILILGANGRTGSEVARTLAKQNLYTITTTRTGSDPFQNIGLSPQIRSFLSHYPQAVDVTSGDSVRNAVETIRPSALVVCASASKKGGTAYKVDGDGPAIVAEEAEKNGLRLVLVSALAVDRPDSKSYQITNSIGGNYDGIMDAKRDGENRVRMSMAKSRDYIIVRPGILLSGKSTGGVAGIELNQGDTIGGGLSRDELAGVVVGALTSGTKGATVEVYRRSTATKLQPEFVVPSTFEKSADSYEKLFANLVLDK